MRRVGHRGEAAQERAPERSARGDASLRRALALLWVGVAAKLLLVGLRAADGEASGLLGPWGPPTLLYQELWAALGLYALDRALLSLGTWLKRPVLADRLCWGLYGLLAGYVAINVPIARQFATPLTYAFVEAAGGALRDSVTQYATAGNVAAFLGLLLWAVVVPRWRWLPRWPWLGPAVVVLLLGPIGAGRSETLGLHRNAAVTLLRTTWARFAPRPAAPQTVTTLPPLGPALDLSHLVGAARGYHVIWVILESTGARHLAMYGAAVDATPRLSQLARTGLVFERMYTSDPESIKSLLPILCGAWPAMHSSAADYAAGASGCAALPAALQAAGYRTGLFHSGHFMYLGMQAMVEGRGFDVLADAAAIGGPYAGSFGTDDRSTARRVLEFIDAEPAGRPVFALYMPIAGHHPYRSPGAGTRPFVARTEAEHHRNDLYVGDEALGELIDGVRARGMMEKTVWIVMGDHGEAFHEHPGNFAHSLFVYEENVHVPAVVVVPGALRQALRVPQVGGSIDLAPTLLELLGLPTIGAGRSLLRGEPGVARFFTDHSTPLLGLRQDRWKCIVEPEAGRVRLFDLEVDPGETVDVAAREPALAERYRAALLAWSAEQSARLGE